MSETAIRMKRGEDVPLPGTVVYYDRNFYGPEWEECVTQHEPVIHGGEPCRTGRAGTVIGAVGLCDVLVRAMASVEEETPE